MALKAVGYEQEAQEVIHSLRNIEGLNVYHHREEGIRLCRSDGLIYELAEPRETYPYNKLNIKPVISSVQNANWIIALRATGNEDLANKAIESVRELENLCCENGVVRDSVYENGKTKDKTVWACDNALWMLALEPEGHKLFSE